jgi:hypothetical protein
MQGHLPGPPQPHEPIGLSPIIGYLATRDPQPLDELSPSTPDWLDADIYDEPWGRGHSRVIKITAVVVAVSMVVAGMSTVLELILSAH